MTVDQMQSLTLLFLTIATVFNALSVRSLYKTLKYWLRIIR